MENAKLDQNSRQTLTAVSSADGNTIVRLWADPVTHALLVSGSASTSIPINVPITGGTPGSVLFIGAGSTLAQDNADFFWDQTNMRLGLGTNTPNYNQQINGGAGLTYLQFTNSTTGTTATDGTIIGFASASNTFQIRNREASTIDFYTTDSNRGRWTPNGGFNVGVLTENAKLYVVNSSVEGGAIVRGIRADSTYTGAYSADINNNNYDTILTGVTWTGGAVYANAYYASITDTTSWGGAIYTNYIRPYMRSSGTIAGLYGMVIEPYFFTTTSTGTVGSYLGLQLSAGAYGGSATSTISNAFQVNILNLVVPVTGAFRALNIADISSGTGTRHAIYVAGATAMSYFQGLVGFGTTAPTHPVTFGSTSTGAAWYNTVDQTTNYERYRAFWSSNIFTISSEIGGTGTSRAFRLVGQSGSQLTIGNITPSFEFTRATSGANATIVTINGNQAQASGFSNLLSITNTITQTGTAGYTAYFANITETSTGSGAKNLIELQVGGVDKFMVNNQGVGFMGQYPTASAPTYVLGGMYFDTTLNKLRIGGAAGWETVTSV